MIYLSLLFSLIVAAAAAQPSLTPAETLCEQALNAPANEMRVLVAPRVRAQARRDGDARAAAMNLKRVVAWLDGVPRSGTRVSHYARLDIAA